MNKKLSTILLSLFMIITTFTANVFADGNVAKIGTTEYATLAEAIADVQNNETIQMIADETINFENSITLNKTKAVTLDLNGHTVKGVKQVNNKDFIWVENGCTLTIKDSGSEGKITSDANDAATIYVEGAVILDSGIVESTGGGDSLGGCVFDVRPNDFGQGQGYEYTTDTTSLTINGGVVRGNNSNTIRLANSAVETTRKNQIVKAIMNGGVIENAGDGFFIQLWTGIECIGNLSVEINGGEIKCKQPVRAFSTSWTTNKKDGQGFIDIAINGGKISMAENGKTYWKGVAVQNIASGGTVENVESFMNVAISGGYFTYNNTLADGVVAGKKVINTPDGDEKTAGYIYTIGEEAKVAQIGDKEYYSLAAAIAAVPNDGTERTITMIDNETFVDNANMTISVDQNIVLDLNGKTVTGKNLNVSSWAFLTNYGALTITDTSDNHDGKITSSTAPETDRFAGHYTVLNKNVLTLENGTIEETSENVGGGSNLKWALRNEASENQTVSLTINGGTVIGEYNAVSNYVYNDSSTCNFTVNGGTIKTTGRFSPVTMQIAGGEKPNCNININGGEFIVENIKNTNPNGNAIIYCDYQASSDVDTSNIKIKIAGGKYNTYKTGMIVEFSGFKAGLDLPSKYMSSGIMKVAIEENEIAPGYQCVANDDESTKIQYPWKIGKLSSGKIVITETENDVPNFYKEVEELQDAIDNVTEANQEKFEENKEIKLSTITVDNTGGINAQIDDTVKIIANESGDNVVKADPGYKLNDPTTEGGKTTYTAQSLDIGKDYQDVAEGTGKKDSKQTATELKQTVEGTTQAVKDSAKSVNDTNANKQLETIVSEGLDDILVNRGIHQGTAAKALNKEGIAITNEGSTGSIAAKNVNVFVLTYYDTEVLEDKTTQANKSYKLDITPMYQAYASTATSKDNMKTEGTGKDSVKIGDSLPVDCTGKTINLKIELPTGFITSTSQKVYVIHKTKTYNTTVTENAGKFYIEFTNPDGFSTFEITLKDPTTTPNSDLTPGYKIPKTGVEGTTTNNHSLLKLSSLSLLAIGTYLVIKKKKDN